MNILTQNLIAQLASLPPQEGQSLLEEFVIKIPTLSEQDKKQTLADFYAFLRNSSADKINPSNEAALLSESALAIDWNRAEEDEAWAEFQ